MGKLWKILTHYSDLFNPEDELLETMKLLVERMQDNPEDYANCLNIFTRMPIEEIYEKFTNIEILDIFAKGLLVNKVLSFMDWVGEV